MSTKPFASLALILAALSSAPVLADEPVKQFNFRFAGIDATSLRPEVASVVAYCDLMRHADGTGAGRGRKEFSVTQVNGEYEVHTGPFTIGVNVGDDGEGGTVAVSAQPSDVKYWRCFFALKNRDGLLQSADGACLESRQWACAKVGTTPVILQRGQF